MWRVDKAPNHVVKSIAEVRGVRRVRELQPAVRIWTMGQRITVGGVSLEIQTRLLPKRGPGAMSIGGVGR